jgi:hypothetical protein
MFLPQKTVYFFVEKKNEALLCEEFTEEIQNKLGVTIYGRMRTLEDLCKYALSVKQFQKIMLILQCILMILFYEFVISKTPFAPVQGLFTRRILSYGCRR